jgi:uncharacterized protein YaaQ
MKLIMAMVQAADSRRLLDALMAEGYRATKIGTTSGLLRRGNATILIGVQDQQVEAVLDLLRQYGHGRQEFVSSLSAPSSGTTLRGTQPVQVEISGMTVFVLDVDAFENLSGQ